MQQTAPSPIFPLPIAPTHPYDSQAAGVKGLRFGVPRHGGPRIHAGCDLCAPFGTPVMAVDYGEVHFPAFNFYGPEFPNIWVIAIWHPRLRDGKGMLVRYGEIEHIPSWLTQGASVKQGKVIGKVSNQGGDSMLHIEFYSTNEKGDTTARSNNKYDNVTPMQFERRHDLLNPTAILKEWQGNIISVAKDAYQP
jgi:murein DD-endopeptidase MepM/ murein hydrolase activator NlpD